MRIRTVHAWSTHVEEREIDDSEDLSFDVPFPARVTIRFGDPMEVSVVRLGDDDPKP